MFKLRNKGIYEVAKVKSGILEQNGQLTVIEFSDKDHVRYPLISDGQLNVDVLELINQDEEWLIGKLNKIGYKDLSEIYIAEYVNGDFAYCKLSQIEIVHLSYRDNCTIFLIKLHKKFKKLSRNIYV